MCQESLEAGKIGGWIWDPAPELWRKRQQETAGLSQPENWKRTCFKSTCIPYSGMAESQKSPWGERSAAPERQGSDQGQAPAQRAPGKQSLDLLAERGKHVAPREFRCLKVCEVWI